MEYRIAQWFHNDLKVPLSLIAHPCNGWEATSGLKSADILMVYHDPGCHCFGEHTQIHAVMQCVSVIHWKKEGFRSVLSILAWVWVACPYWEALIWTQPSIWGTNQIKSWWAGKAWKQRETATEKKGLSGFFFQLSDRADGALGQIMARYESDMLQIHWCTASLSHWTAFLTFFYFCNCKGQRMRLGPLLSEPKKILINSPSQKLAHT